MSSENFLEKEGPVTRELRRYSELIGNLAGAIDNLNERVTPVAVSLSVNPTDSDMSEPSESPNYLSHELRLRNKDLEDRLVRLDEVIRSIEI